ncbi:MAG: glycosyltransferase involved in cell wall biosynthesis [Candidatus Promineifilaceae bacterium]|jgi:glycosyltransferase involved in cell wall biosynthesis
MIKKIRIAIVVQRYGENISGGAELHARMVAEHLLEVGNVDVFTTCAKDYLSWKNEFPAGTTRINGVRVNRYPVVEERELPNRTTEDELFQKSYALDLQYNWMWRVGPASPELLKRIERAEPEFDVFIFFTYEYAHAVFGLPLVKHKAILVPEAHEQQHLQLPIFRLLFSQPRAIAYNVPAEQEFVERLTGNHHIPSAIVALGVDEPEGYSAERFRQKFGVNGPFITYLGRLVAEKGVDRLIQDFIQYKKIYPSDLVLVLMGKGNLTIPDRPDIIVTGFVTDQEKYDGLAAADLLVLPSKWESLSIIILEAWLVGTPVLVNFESVVTVAQAQRSQGGLYYRTFEEFAGLLRRIILDKELQTALAANGRKFVLENYNWEIIVEKYRQLFKIVMSEPVISTKLVEHG